MEDESVPRRFYAVSYEEDIPKSERGVLIPYQRPKQPALPPQRAVSVYRQYRALMVLPAVAALFLLLLGAKSLMPSGSGSLASVSSSLQDDGAALVKNDGLNLSYGVEVALSRPAVFAETREVLIEAEKDFIEVDLEEMILRFFDKGVLTFSTNILAKGETGSWWQTPSGLYRVESKEDNYYSEAGRVYQPWSIVFEGNLIIHGWPKDELGNEIDETKKVGGVRMVSDKAKELYELVQVGDIVLVHDASDQVDDFLYEPKVPELKTPHYLIADVKSSTVLASSDLDAVAPIASVTKLMTALVATEEINLDKRVYASEPTFVQSLIPRLGDRSQVSMYSLLRLLLEESSNEAAEVIASVLGREEFISLMNARAKSLGMLNTTFADPSGLSALNTSSLSDMLRLTEYIYKNRSFIFNITAGESVESVTNSNEFGELVNFNRVPDLENFIGGKVGETLAAGQTSVTLHELEVKGEKRVVAIILFGSENRNEDVQELLRYAKERFGN